MAEGRCLAMLNKVVITLALFVLATASGMGTWIVLSASAEGTTKVAVKADRVLPADCKIATWPSIPDHCLGFSDSRRVRVIAFGV